MELAAGSNITEEKGIEKTEWESLPQFERSPGVQCEGPFKIAKCISPIGLSRDLIQVQKLMSYRLDDPGTTVKSLAERFRFTRLGNENVGGPTRSGEMRGPIVSVRLKKLAIA